MPGTCVVQVGLELLLILLLQCPKCLVPSPQKTFFLRQDVKDDLEFLICLYFSSARVRYDITPSLGGNGDQTWASYIGKHSNNGTASQALKPFLT